MSDREKQNIVKLILKYQSAIRKADVAILGLMAQLPLNEPVTIKDQVYWLESIFNDGEIATWRPARVHKYHLVIRKK